MAGVVKCCVLFMSVGFSSHSSLGSFDTVTVLKGEHGKSINITCATNKSTQDGVYMIRKKLNDKVHQSIFYYLNDDTFTIKMNISVSINKEAFPNITATLNNLTVADTGFYWCTFNLEEKKTNSAGTFLFVTDENMNVFIEKKENCQNGTVFYVMIALFALTLCIHGFLYVKVKRRYHCCTPSKKSQDPSIYEEMSRNRVDTSSTLINSAYQSTK